MESTTVQEGGLTITSTSENAEQIRESIAEPPEQPVEQEQEPDPVSKAAAELGKRGSEVRKAKAELEAELTEEQELANVEQLEKEGKLGKPRHDPRAAMLDKARKLAVAKREREAAKAEAEQARKELAEYRKQVEASKAPETQKQAAAVPGKPALSDFQTYDEWVEAVSDWKVEQRLQARDAQTAQETNVREYAKGINDMLGKAVAARNEYIKTDPQFLSKISDEVKAAVRIPSAARGLEEVLTPDHVITDEILLAEQVGPRLMLHFSAHPEELKRIRELNTPQEIQVEMRLLARSLGTVTSAPKGAVSMAKPPIRPVTSSSHVPDAAPGEDAPYADHRRYWGAKDRAARR